MIINNNRRVLATMYGVGLVKRAPGTAGSFVAAIMAYFILLLPHGWAILAAGTALFSWFGLRSADRYMVHFATEHDPKEVVIDELAGQWLTYLVWYMMIGGASAAYGVSFSQIDVEVTPFIIALGFVLFRLFDILKPWPISYVDRHIKGAFGVMFDDILAAIPAGVLLYFAYAYGPLLFGTKEMVS